MIPLPMIVMPTPLVVSMITPPIVAIITSTCGCNDNLPVFVMPTSGYLDHIFVVAMTTPQVVIIIIPNDYLPCSLNDVPAS